jgi:hypothetical protein
VRDDITIHGPMKQSPSSFLCQFVPSIGRSHTYTEQRVSIFKQDDVTHVDYMVCLEFVPSLITSCFLVSYDAYHATGFCRARKCQGIQDLEVIHNEAKNFATNCFDPPSDIAAKIRTSELACESIC